MDARWLRFKSYKVFVKRAWKWTGKSLFDRPKFQVNFNCFFQLIIFGGMNNQKDFNDVCILQTRSALKHLPTEMAGN